MLSRITPLDVGSFSQPDRYNLTPEPLVEFWPPANTAASYEVPLAVPPTTCNFVATVREELSLTAPVESMRSFSVGADVPSLAVEKTNLPGVSPTEPPFASTSPSINAFHLLVYHQKQFFLLYGQ